MYLNQESKKSDSDAAELPWNPQHNNTSITLFLVSQLKTCPWVDKSFGSFLPLAATPKLCPKSSADHLVSCRLASDVSHPPGWDPQGWKRKGTANGLRSTSSAVQVSQKNQNYHAFLETSRCSNNSDSMVGIPTGTRCKVFYAHDITDNQILHAAAILGSMSSCPQSWHAVVGKPSGPMLCRWSMMFGYVWILYQDRSSSWPAKVLVGEWTSNG